MLQQENWTIGMRNALRKIKSRCIKCRHWNANPIHPPMADLPRERLDENLFPFTITGVDYFGPFEVKSLRRTLKKWCCLFTCLTTRAVHFEVAQSLDIESCLAAVTRFIARRGYPNTINSDNSANFVGAANELKAFMNEWDKAKIESDLAEKKIVRKSRRSSLLWNLEGRGTQQNNVSCGPNTQRKTPDSSKWWPWRFDGTHAKSFLARTRERECTIHAIQWTLRWPEKIFIKGSSIYRHDIEKMDSKISSTMESEIEVIKRTCAKPERRRVSMASRWLCEMLWV